MNPRQPGHTPATDFTDETEEQVQRLYARVSDRVNAMQLAEEDYHADKQSKEQSLPGTCKNCYQWHESRSQGLCRKCQAVASPPPPVLTGRYDADDLAAFRLLGEARAIIAELTSPYWNHKAQGKAREWLRRYDDRHDAAMERITRARENNGNG